MFLVLPFSEAHLKLLTFSGMLDMLKQLMDGFDPVFAPGVSHREAGGLTSREAIDLYPTLKGRLVGADIVEFNPHQDASGITASLWAKLAKDLVSCRLPDTRIDKNKKMCFLARNQLLKHQ